MSTQNKFAVGDKVRIRNFSEHLNGVTGVVLDSADNIVLNALWVRCDDTLSTYYFYPDELDLIEKASNKSVEWDGEGLPPAGVVCEYSILGAGPWYECRVRYVLDNDPSPDADGWTAVIWCPHLEKEQIATPPTIQFRPIKTKEQLEEEAKAQEREKVIEDIARVISSKISDKRAAESLYELGYRKMEIDG